MSTATADPTLHDAPGTAGRCRSALLTAASAGAAFLILIGLGTWQLQRLAWKTGVIARVAALQSASPRPLASVLVPLARGDDLDFTRVETSCPTLEQTPTVRLYALKEAMGYRLITACPIRGAGFQTLLVDRGFIARDEVGKVGPSSAPLAGSITGVLRRGDRPGWFTPRHAQVGADWYGRDIPAMATELRAPSPAPIFLMLERPSPRGFGPTPSPFPGEIRNPHLGYALTWFGLAAALAGVYLGAALRPRPRA